MALRINRVLAAKMLTGLATVGVGITAYIAVKRADKIKAAVEEVRKENAKDRDESSDDSESKWSKLEAASRYISRVASVSWPLLASVAVTDALIIGAQVLSLTEIGILTGTIGYLVANRKELEQEIKKLPGGEEALKRAKEAVAAQAQEKKEPWTKLTVEQTGRGEMLCIDPWLGLLYSSSPEEVVAGQKRFNDRWDKGEYLSWNDYRHEQGLTSCHAGSAYGYSANHDYYDHFNIKFENQIVRAEDIDYNIYPSLKGIAEDVFVTDIPGDYYPMPGWMEV